MQEKEIVHYAILNGLHISTMEEFYSAIKPQLLIPDYFGNNLDALEETLADLEWINADKIYIILIHKEAFLPNAERERNSIIDIFNQNDNPRVTIIIV